MMPGIFLLSTMALLSILAAPSAGLKNAVRGKKCTQNQVVNKLTVYEDGAIEAECGPLPCGQSGSHCSEDMSSCKAASEVFSGMRWARNGQSLLLRCCTLQAGNKVYIGTDLVTLGSYYTGGLVPEKDMMGSTTGGGGGVEYDFVSNVRIEQGGVRVWVYRVVCPANSPSAAPHSRAKQQQREEMDQQQQQIKFAEAQDGQVESEPQQQQQQQQQGEQEEQTQQPAAQQRDEEEESTAAAPNPLQYRPRRNRPTMLEAANRVL